MDSGKFCTGFPGYSNCEAIRTFRAAAFFRTGFPGHTSRVSDTHFPGGEFRRLRTAGFRALRSAGTLRLPGAGAKRKGHLRFPFLFELLPFPWRASVVIA